jgi:hypothetical protein
MRKIFMGIALILGSLLFVQSTAAYMESQAMRGHEVSTDFTPPRLQPDFAPLPPTHQQKLSSFKQPAPRPHSDHA